MMQAFSMRMRGRPLVASAFYDDFNRADEDLEASPNWTRVGGSAGDIDITSNVAYCRRSGDGTAYQCPDFGVGDKYVQGVIQAASGQFFPLCLRLTDNANFIGVRYNSGAYQLYSRTGSFVLLGSYSADPLLLARLEMVGDDFEVFVDGVSRITATYSGNSAETRQGMVARNSINQPMLDDFEAGLL